MAFDGIVIASLVHEFNRTIAGGKIAKIAQPEKDELLFTIKNNRENYRLLLSVNASLPLAYLTDGFSWQRTAVLCYGFFYLNAVFFGCVARLTLVWNLSDIFNGLMAVPNLIGVFLLRREVRLPALRQK